MLIKRTNTNSHSTVHCCHCNQSKMDTPQKICQKKKKRRKKKKGTPTTTEEPDTNLPTVLPLPSPTTTQQPFHQRVRPTALSVDLPSPTHQDMDQAMNQMLERIIDLEQRLAASTTNYLQQVDTPVITPRIKAYQPCQTPSLSVRRPTTGTGLTPPPSPKPEEVANALCSETGHQVSRLILLSTTPQPGM